MSGQIYVTPWKNYIKKINDHIGENKECSEEKEDESCIKCHSIQKDAQNDSGFLRFVEWMKDRFEMKQYNEKTYQYFKEMQESRLEKDKQGRLLSRLLSTTRYDKEQKFHENALEI